ncbi:hypothetical protein [Aquihabitans sp. McL0605]|uniref:hypothetical protein n=1 Tax=Aquihabitans sp. McL0605 TaxID=3415671 RepID=UPI003CEB5E2E
MSATTEAPDDGGQRYGPVFWITAAIGAAVVAFGVRGLWINERTGVPSAARWFVGGALALDLLVVPLGAMAGWVAKRLVPAWSWPVVRAVLFTSVVLIAFALPLVTHQGGLPDNPTVRPRDYRTGLGWALGATWLVGAAALVVIAIGRSRRPAAHGGPADVAG